MKTSWYLLWLGLCAGPILAQEMVIAKEITVHSDSPDTFTTVYYYDKLGFLVHKITNDSLISDWDEKGRYLGLRVRGDTGFQEKVQWFTEDSSQRLLVNIDMTLAERFFGRKKNSTNADSVYIYRDIHTPLAKVMGRFDSHGHPTRYEVLYYFPEPDLLDTTSLYRHTYGPDGRLISTVEADLESDPPVERTTTYEYADLSTLIVERQGVPVVRRRIRPPFSSRSFRYFDVLGRRFAPKWEIGSRQ